MSGVLSLAWRYNSNDHRRKVTVVRQPIRTSDNLAGPRHDRCEPRGRSSNRMLCDEFDESEPPQGVFVVLMTRS